MAPRVLIFGTGGIGGGYAYVLCRKLPTENVVAICRSGYETAKRDGLTINSTIWGDNIVFRPTIARSVEEALVPGSDPFDYVVVATKILSTGTPTVELIKPAISTKTSIVLLQNGIGIEETYKTQFPNNPILSGVVYFAVTRTAPTILNHSEVEAMHIGTYPAEAPEKHTAAAKAFVDLIKHCDATVTFHADVQGERWKKLVMNASMNPICALTRSRDTAFIASGPGSEKFMEDVMNEVVTVAQAYGYEEATRGIVGIVMNRVRNRKGPGVEPSMMADVIAGRNMEVEALVGNCVNLAQAKGIDVPLLRTIYILSRALDDSLSRQRT